MPGRIRLAVVDDHALVREGLSAVLGAEGDIEVVAELSSGDELLEFLSAGVVAVDIVLLDLYLPGMDGIATLARIRETVSPPVPRVVMLTSLGRTAEIERAFAAGAAGFALKDSSGSELAAALRGAHQGITALTASASRTLWADMADQPRSAPKSPPPVSVDLLTDRENQVLDLLGEGMSNQDIAKKLRLAERTVKHHVTGILGKLGVTSRTQAALAARDRNG